MGSKKPPKAPQGRKSYEELEKELEELRHKVELQEFALAYGALYKGFEGRA